jgi:Zn-dependent M28 family amino/carboxypeptidase
MIEDISPPLINKEKLRNHIEEICSRSPRYAGTKGEDETIRYIIGEGSRFGINVLQEQFDYLHYRPRSSRLEVYAPFEEVLDHLPLCYAGNGVAVGDVVYAGAGGQEDLETLHREGVQIEGKIVMASNGFPHFTYPVAEKYGAAGYIVLTDAPGNLCRAGTATANFEPGKIPGVLVPATVGQRLLMLMSTSRLKLRVTSQGAFSNKASVNIIMTIPGSTWPAEEIVLVTHYDSHNLGKHAWDNASGCASVLELTRCFSQARPARTIKSIFFGVEELGLCWGSSSYVKRHTSEMSFIKAVVTFDGMGCPYDHQFQLRTTKEARPFAIAVMNELGHHFTDRELGARPGPIADYEPFKAQGVPVIWVNGEKPIYFHTAGDDPETLDYDRLKILTDINREIIHRLATSPTFPF